MREKNPSIEKLEKQLRVIKKKLERAQWHRVDLENQHDRDQHLYRRLHADLEAARREAEIEAALERVRTKAMAMRKPEDLSGISETVFTELKALGFTNLRNTEIIINHDTEASITSYYYSDYGVTGVIEVDYRTNPTLEAWAREMQKADDAFVEIVIDEDEMASWRTYRLSLGYVPDPKLDEATAIYYYSYSIGLGALSISSFQPVDAEHLKVLQQFRNVFNLAYQRYVDIARAEAQAREAQIQLALERIRAQSMLMQHSSELVATSTVFHEQLQALGVPTEFSYVWLPDEAAGKHQFWATWTEEEDGEPVHHRRAITYDLDKEEPYTAACFAAWESEERLLVDFIPPSEIEHFFGTWEELVGGAEHLRPERFPKGIYYAEGYMQYGCFGINIRREPTEAEQDILRRFAVEFERAYTRFLDLGRAEAQAREAQIEAALERVRSRTMAMHHSDEIAEVARITFEQFQGLAFPSIRRISIGIMDTEAHTMSFWASATTEGESIRRVTVPMEENAAVREIVAGWRAGIPYFSFSYEGNTLREFVAHITQHGWAYPVGEQMPERLLMNFVSYRYGLINASTYEPIGEDEYAILQRFARVFEQTYTRFLDLKKAEAQAREAEIEAALERVRARAMAMHRSDDVGAAVHTVFEELRGLGLEHMRCGLGLIDGETRRVDLYTTATSEEGAAMQQVGNVLLAEDPIAANIYAHWQRDEDYFPVLEGETLRNYHRHLRPGLAVPDWQADYTQYGFFIYFSDFDGGLYGWSEKPYTDAEVSILRRFASVLGLTYRRYLDIQQAEAQAREAEIELALERVRARTMAMQQSTDISDVAQVLFQQLKKLGGQLWGTGFGLCTPDAVEVEFWFVNESGILPPVAIPNTDSPVHVEMYAAWQQKRALYTVAQGGAELAAHYEYMLSVPDVRPFFEGILASGLSFPTWQKWHAAYFSHGYLLVITVEPYEEEGIFVRFARVFEQAYTRFLDLKKAEAQARKAEIEAALERVRARAMAMHSSDDISDATAIVFTELERLGIVTLRCGIVIIHETRHMDAWTATATAEERDVRIVGQVDMTIHPLLEGVFEAWKAHQDFYMYEMVGEDLQAYYQAIAHETNYPLPDQSTTSAWQCCYAFFFQEGGLFAFAEQPLTEDAIEVFKRFAAVFALTYRRYLDLKKAEAQAREAEIEAALERVRARAMAMHSSDDISDATAVVFTELERLGIATHRCGINIIHDNGDMDLWTAMATEADSDLRILGRLDASMHPMLEALFTSWKAHEPYFTHRLAGDDLRTYYQALQRAPLYAFPPEAIPSETQFAYLFFFPEGGLFTFSAQPLTEASLQIYQRFTAVFALTYRRYLDLQQAEARAREAQIEAALERVRARTMAMQKSEELSETSALLFAQIKELGIETWSSGFNILEDDERACIGYNATPAGGIGVPIRLPLTEDPFFRTIYEAKKRGDEFLVFTSEGESLAETYRYMFTLPVVKDVMQGIVDEGYDLPTYQVTHCGFFSHGHLMFITLEPYPEAWDVFKRFTKVFEQTYTRFLDLKNSEAQARQARQQAALDRVRAEIASMRTAADLEQITPLVWRELTTLGVPFFRCGVFIIDEATETTQVFLTTPEGKALAAISMGFAEAPIVAATVDHWRHEAVYTEEWDAAEMQAWTQFLQERGLIETSTRYLDAEVPPEHLALHFVPFKQGMLYVGSTALLDDAAIDAVQSLADAFAVAYARYEDFQRLEAKKQEVEAALTSLQAAQQQLIHAEKMASLGALTAGIAHEIKNPLNFINNFAELNEELAQELREALATGDDPDAIAELLADLEQNASVIKQHGKRADSIVRSMMAHARTSTHRRAQTDLNTLVAEHVALAYHGKRATVPAFNAEVVKDLSADIGTVSVVPQDLGRVILNLVGNAFDAVATVAHPRVTISTRRVGEAVEIRVADNGPGIPDDVRERIFEPFFTTKPTGAGTGLGLSLSYDIVTQGHGGTLTVKSQEGKGATFIVTLPTSNTEPASSA